MSAWCYSVLCPSRVVLVRVLSLRRCVVLSSGIERAVDDTTFSTSSTPGLVLDQQRLHVSRLQTTTTVALAVYISRDLAVVDGHGGRHQPTAGPMGTSWH